MKKVFLFLILLSMINFGSEFSQESIVEKLKPFLENARVYKKFKKVYARSGKLNEEILTYTSDGLETKNIVKKGDMVVQNMTNAKEQYIVPLVKFNKKYSFYEKYNDEWSIYMPKGEIKAVLVDKKLLKELGINEKEFYIKTAWNEKMIVKENDYLVSPIDMSEVYRIAKTEFFETYR
ncbi:hypothetical protein [Sneathia sanguinegens]|uniref:hypothetical protein n=1 Tax=Sneathia sanguinegens TaxID=40543 RepID=UPI0023F6A71D|nr:hypothetical protein [Sneathia sanguinegens]